LYKVRYRAEVEHLERYGAPGDAVLSDASTPFARHDPNANFFGIADEKEIVAALNDWSAAHTRLWYFHYPVASPITSLYIHRQLDTFAARLDEIDLDYVTATLYILPGDPIFAVSEEMPADFGSLAVKGAVLIDRDVPADGTVRFTLRWQAESTPDASYAPFIHLVDRAGHLRAAGRGDDVLVDERYWPTFAWSPGNEAELTYSLGFPSGLPPGPYHIHVGLSNAETGEWIPALDEETRIVGTTAPVLDVNVRPARMAPAPENVKLAHPQSIIWRNQLKLFGVDYPARANIGETIVIGAGWLALNTFDQAYDVRLSLRAQDTRFDNNEPALEQTFPLSQYPTVEWRRNEVIHELYDLVLPGKADKGRPLAGGSYTLSIEVLDENGTRLSPPVEIGEIDIVVEERLFELPSPPQHALDLHLGAPVNGQHPIALTGYDTDQTETELTLTLYWQCNTALETSYTVFVHLLDENGQVQAQNDQLPVQGRAPTGGWVEEQIVIDTHIVAIAETAPPGPYRIEVGMYDRQTMTRLPVFDAGGGRQTDDRALLDTEIVIPKR
jgi:hypothetical protein